eukprot:Skav218091  [mRNA]  locus=scaffold1801:84833:85651:- [translate_table: standard]
MTLTVETVLQLLGWSFATDGKKAPPFSDGCAALGVVIDLSRMRLGITLNPVSQLPSRRFLNGGSLSKQGALQRRSRMQFPAGQFYGRVARTVLGAIAKRPYDSVSAELPPRALMCLSVYKETLLSNKPRVLSLKSSAIWMFFTDACYEPDHTGAFAGLGGVLISPKGQIHRYYSHQLSSEQLTLLNPKGAKTLIFEWEFLAVLVALHLWSLLTAGSQILFFIHNNAARDSLISCHSNNPVGQLERKSFNMSCPRNRTAESILGFLVSPHLQT